MQKVLDTPADGALPHLSDRVAAIYSTDNSVRLLWKNTAIQRLLLWDPPKFSTHRRRSLLEIWGGSSAPYALTAAAMNSLERGAGLLHVQSVDADQTGTMVAWKTVDGTAHLFLATLKRDYEMTRIAPASSRLTYPTGELSAGTSYGAICPSPPAGLLIYILLRTNPFFSNLQQSHEQVSRNNLHRAPR